MIGAMITDQFGQILLLVALAVALLAYYLNRRDREIRRRTLAELLALSPSDFEVAVATLLKDLGYRSVKVTGRTGDLAADIVCHDQQGHKVLVQCKRYSPRRPVGSPEIQLFIGMLVHHQSDRGIYVTTSRFTSAASALARQHGLELIDGARLATLIAGRHPVNDTATSQAGSA